MRRYKLFHHDVNNRNTITEFANNMNLVLREYRNNELVVDFNSVYSEPVMSTSVEKIEKFAAKTYTRNVLKKIKPEIERACALNVELKSEDEHTILLDTNEFGHAEDGCLVIWRRSILVSCDCRLFENRETDYEKTVKMCQGTLAADCNLFRNIACKSFEDFIEIRNDIVNLIRKLQVRLGLSTKHILYTGEVVDPLVVKTKGAPANNAQFVKRKRC
ncbi:hypothetical protein PIB30_038452 [Stylosanthes scabra]|uniref:Protein FAR1-RELATED SEQUENCE n=1 Tax=Stylosanthes scabra TaxID=79078 RepID=A0ABU6XDN6_9FABA|nr:hypothetical protein [Stylosanthes scabra]